MEVANTLDSVSQLRRQDEPEHAALQMGGESTGYRELLLTLPDRTERVSDPNAPGSALVQRGERIFSTPQNEEILDILRESRGSSRGGVNVTIQVETFIGEESFADEFADKISRAIVDRNVDLRTQETEGF